MDAPACAVGRLDPGGTWVGFAPTLDDAYAFVVGTESGSRRAAADPDDLVSLAIAYFEEALADPPDDLAATHGDIGALVRHLAEHEADPGRRRAFDEAVDAIDDGLAADEVIGRLGRCLSTEEEAAARLARRAAQLGER